MMKINFFVACSILLLTFGCKTESSNKNVEATTNKEQYSIPSKAKVIDYENNTQLIVIKTDDKKGEVRGFLVNGKKHGTWTTYNKDGYPQEIKNYKNGQLHGSTFYMDARSRVKKREDYVENKLNGQVVNYGASQIVKKSHHQNDKLEGSYARYYPNGELMEQSYYVNGLKDGESIYYAKSGEVKMKYLYKEGKMIEELSK